MRRHSVLLLTIAVLAGCDFQILDLDDSCFLSCGFGGWGPPPSPAVRVTGQVWIGEYPATEEEAKVLLYAASDTMHPLDSIFVSGGSYWRELGPEPTATICGYKARAVQWSGETTALAPLFSGAGCVAATHAATGPRFDLPPYAPLAEPFVLRGRVLVDGTPARPGDVTVTPWLRLRPGELAPPSIATDAAGGWVHEVNDGAQRFALCRGAGAGVLHVPSGRSDGSGLGRPSRDVCANQRVLPEVRLGTRKAATVGVLSGPAASEAEAVAAGEATVSLALPADSSLVGEEFTTLDDGIAHVWFPHDMSSPGCSFLIRVELAARVQYLPLLPPPETICRENVFQWVQLIGS